MSDVEADVVQTGLAEIFALDWSVFGNVPLSWREIPIPCHDCSRSSVERALYYPQSKRCFIRKKTFASDPHAWREENIFKRLNFKFEDTFKSLIRKIFQKG